MRVGLCRKKYKAKVICIACSIVFALLLYIILKRLEPTFVTISRSYGEMWINNVVSENITKVFMEYPCDGLQKYQDGIIVTDTATLNKLKSKLTIMIQNDISTSPNIIKIPLGSISGIYLLNGLGPDVRVKIHPINKLSMDFEDEFVGEGINFVKHSIYVTCSVELAYRGFLLNSSSTVTTRLPIIENINSGDVPNYYGGFGIPNQIQ